MLVVEAGREDFLLVVFDFLVVVEGDLGFVVELDLEEGVGVFFDFFDGEVLEGRLLGLFCDGHAGGFARAGRR